jgi:DNA-directed RNA polymerase subunit K/omega
MAERRPGPEARPKDTDALRLDVDPSGGQVVALWRSTESRFPDSRKTIRRARDLVNKAPSTMLDPFGSTTGGSVPFALPQRMLAVTMTNSLSSQYGTPELTRYGKPVASDKSDQIETVLKATLDRLLSVPDLFGKATQDGQWGIAVLPAGAEWDHIPLYSAEGYDLDAEDRSPGDAGYTSRDPARSRRAFDRDYEAYCARCDYVAIDVIDPTDCAPILTRGTHGRRFAARGLLVRRLFEREELLAQGYRSPALSAEKSTLIPRGDRATARGKGGKLYLYTAYVSLWDEDDECLVPCIVYSVAGEDTRKFSPRTGEHDAALINLREEWGIETPMWGYYHGLRTADPDPDKVGLPFLDAYAGLVLALERMLAASVAHAERSSFKGSWVEPGENVPPEAYTETVENQLRLKSFDEPVSGELMTAPGRVTPVAPPPLGTAATQMMAALMQQLQVTSPDPAQPAGSGASGHAMSLASGLIEAAHSDIPRGVLECYEDVASWVLECICAVMKTKQVPYVIDANEELPPDEPGERRAVSQRYVLSEKDIGDSYHITATWRQRPDPVNVTLAMDRATQGFASIVDVLEAAGETNTTYKIAEILYYRAVMTPGTPENLELSAYVARKRGETSRAEQLEMEAKALLEPQGTPSDAIAPEAQQMAAMAAGQPSGVATGAKSSIAATVQGAQEGGPTMSDQQAGAAMGVRAAVPPSVGNGVP